MLPGLNSYVILKGDTIILYTGYNISLIFSVSQIGTRIQRVLRLLCSMKSVTISETAETVIRHLTHTGEMCDSACLFNA